jgi:hypothetical protein
VVKRDSWLEAEWVSMQKKQRLAEKKNKSGKRRGRKRAWRRGEYI